MALPLRRRILWWSVASTLIIVFAAFLIVDGIIRRTIERDQRETLEAGSRLVDQLQTALVQDYVQRTASLASAPTLRAAVETGDPSTIRENLQQMLEGAAVDWIAVTDTAGRVLAATDSTPSLDAATMLVRSARYFDSAELWVRDGRMQQVHASGIFFGSTRLGVILTGLIIGSDRIAEMEAATLQNVAFLGRGAVVAANPALSGQEQRELAAAWASAADDTAGSGMRRFDLAGERYVGLALALDNGRGGTAGRIVTFRSLDAAMQPARAVRYALLGIAAIGLLLAFGASYVLAQRVTRPVNRLLVETVRLGSGNLDNPVEPEQDDELGQLALGFETMRLSLRGAQEELVRAERLSAVGRAASAIVHDIKQPITVIQGHVDLLREDLGAGSGSTEDLDAISHELGRLNGMMGEVLDFARGAESMRFSEGSVRDLLDAVARAVRPLLREGGVRLVVAHGYDGIWRLDFARTHRLLENLVRNAIAVLQQRGHGTVVLRSTLTESGALRPTHA